MILNLLIVAMGGGIGAACRYAISLLPFGSSFPFATFLTNLAGAFLIGIIAGISEREAISEKLTLFLKTGICGGFTTFSTFSLESVSLLADGKYLIGGIYMAASLLCCIIGVVLGQWCVR